MICPGCKLDTLSEEKDRVVCSNCGLKATLWEYNIWKKVYPTKPQRTEKTILHENENTYVRTQLNTSDRVLIFEGSRMKRIYPLGFFYLIAIGCIIGLFSGDALIFLTLVADWIAHAPYSSMLANATIILFFGTIVSITLLVWLIHEAKTLRRK
jgi:uncharacterized membrane protein